MLKPISLLIGFAALACAGAAEQGPAYYPVDRLEQEFGSGDAAATSAVRATGATLSGQSGITAVIDDRNAVLGEVRLADGAAVHPGFTEVYTIEFADGRTLTIPETELEVVGRRGDASMVETDSIHPALPGVRWRRCFYRQGPGLLAKRVTVYGGDSELFLLVSRALAGPAPEGDGAYIWNSPFGYYPPEAPSMTAGTAARPGPPYVFPVTVLPGPGVAVGLYVDAINSRAIHGRETSIWNLKDGKLEMFPFVGEFLGRGGKRALEYEWIVQVTVGDALDFYREYQARKGYRELMGALPDQEWVDHVRIAMDCGTMDLLGHGWEPGKPLRPLDFSGLLNDDPQDAMVWTIFSWGNLGGMPSEGEWQIYEPAPAPMNTEAMRHMVRGLSGADGRIRVALYDWNYSFDPATPPYNRPENRSWASYKRDGSYCSTWACTTFTQWWPKIDAMPNYLDPGYLSFYLGQMAKLPRVYGTGAVYIDAEVGQCYADWASHTWFQPYDQYDFKRKYRLASGDNLPLIKNTPNSPYVSGGYWEGRGLVPAAEAEANWRTVGAKILADKIWQYESRWTALMGGNRGDKLPNYANYIVGLGFKPHAMTRLQEYPLSRAAYEMRHCRLAADRFAPCYWRGDATELEVYPVEVGDALVLNCVSHAAETASHTVTLAGGGRFDGRRPLWSWVVEVDTTAEMPEAMQEDYRRIEAEGGYPDADPAAVARWRHRRISRLAVPAAEVPAGQGVAVEFTAAPRLLYSVVLSELPLAVLSHGSDTVQMLLPGVAEVVFSDHQIDGNRHRVTVESRLGTTVGALAPWSGVAVDGKAVTPEESGVAGIASGVRLEPGTHRLEFSL